MGAPGGGSQRSITWLPSSDRRACSPAGGSRSTAEKGCSEGRRPRLPRDHSGIPGELTHFVDLDDSAVAWSAGGGRCDAQL